MQDGGEEESTCGEVTNMHDCGEEESTWGEVTNMQDGCEEESTWVKLLTCNMVGKKNQHGVK